MAILILYNCWWQIFFIFLRMPWFPLHFWRIFFTRKELSAGCRILSWPLQHFFNTLASVVSHNNFLSFTFLSPSICGVSFLSVCNVHFFSLCFSEVWLWCALIWISLGLSCLRFAWLLKSVVLWFSPHLGSFKTLLNRALFQFCPHFFSSQNSRVMEVRSSDIAPHIPEALFLCSPAHFLLSVVQNGSGTVSYLWVHCFPVCLLVSASIQAGFFLFWLL